MDKAKQPSEPKSWPDYRAIWRWHFYAGLFCIPFVVVLSISGSIYLFKPQIESWIERPYDSLSIQGRPAPASEQIKAALAAVPDSGLISYELPATANAAARVVVSDGAGEGATRVYVHPETLEIVGRANENARLMRRVFRLHGELWMGNRGSALVELAASWTIVMILTGLLLWWPRKTKSLGGVVYPRLFGSNRIFWRDMHGVTGFWISGLTLFLLVSGLPWAKFWGDYLRKARSLAGVSSARQDWTNGAAPPIGASKAEGSGSGEHGDHGSGAGSNRGPNARRMRQGAKSLDFTAADRVVATVVPLNLDLPVVVEPPKSNAGDWSAKSMTPNRPRRVDLTLDGATGAIKERKDFKDRHIIDRMIGIGIAAHEGQLFGWPNQLLGVITAVGLTMLCVSSAVLWIRRREPGVLGAPSAAASPRAAWGLIAIVIALGVYLPLFGVSLIAVLALEWLILRRIPPIRDWLGLSPMTSNPSVRAISAAACET